MLPFHRAAADSDTLPQLARGWLQKRWATFSFYGRNWNQNHFEPGREKGTMRSALAASEPFELSFERQLK